MNTLYDEISESVTAVARYPGEVSVPDAGKALGLVAVGLGVLILISAFRRSK